jgi:3-dehydroquinate synthetase
MLFTAIFVLIFLAYAYYMYKAKTLSVVADRHAEMRLRAKIHNNTADIRQRVVSCIKTANDPIQVKSSIVQEAANKMKQRMIQDRKVIKEKIKVVVRTCSIKLLDFIGLTMQRIIKYIRLRGEEKNGRIKNSEESDR